MTKAKLVASLIMPPSPDGREVLALGGVADWLEVRADAIGDIDADWLRGLFPGPLLYSLRSSHSGGAFEGSPVERAARLLKAARTYDCVELEEQSDLRAEILDGVVADKRLISWYVNSANGEESFCGSHRFSSFPARTYKIVVRGARSGDAIAPLILLKSLGRSDVVAYASGESGLWTRLLAPQFGAPLIFASAGSSSAPDGEPSAFQLTRDFGLPSLSHRRGLWNHRKSGEALAVSANPQCSIQSTGPPGPLCAFLSGLVWGFLPRSRRQR